jgi:CRP/FNR family cyclic AMP-dependent transcriptional regulator
MDKISGYNLPSLLFKNMKGSTMENREILQGFDLFSGMTEEQFEQLALATELVEKKRDDVLFHVGEEAKDLFLLLDGKVSIQVKLSSRPETVGIVVLQNSGQLVGWSGLFERSYYTARAICLEDTRLLQVNGKKLMDVLESDQAAGFEVMREIARVISTRIRNLQSVVLKTI